MVNLELYKLFVIVAKEENITKASNILNISQPAVTKHIKNLEEILKFKLFERTNKGLILTDAGNELYQKLREPIHEIIYIDNQYNSIRNINIGSHNHLLNKIFGKCISQFYLEYPEVTLNLKNFETDEMLKMLKNKELDIVFSKKVDNQEGRNIKYMKLGYLNDIFIVNKNSELVNKIISKNDLKNQIIYVPRTYAQTVNRLLNLMNHQTLNLKHSSYRTILELVNASTTIGLITKEYLDEGDFEKYNLSELKTELNLEPVEFGIYLNDSRFKELNNLIQIIKQNFKL